MNYNNAFQVPFYGPGNKLEGIWVLDPDHPNLIARLKMFVASEGLGVEAFAAFSSGSYRRVDNTRTDIGNNVVFEGGAFLMLGDAKAPSELVSEMSEQIRTVICTVCTRQMRKLYITHFSAHDLLNKQVRIRCGLGEQLAHAEALSSTVAKEYHSIKDCNASRHHICVDCVVAYWGAEVLVLRGSSLDELLLNKEFDLLKKQASTATLIKLLGSL